MAGIYGGANVSNQIAALKELYDNPSDYMQDLVYRENPLLAMMPKDESPSAFGGKYLPVPVVFAAPAGRSATFANAQTYQTAPGDIAFFVYRVSNYQLAQITNELLESTKDNAGAFVEQGKFVMDSAIVNITNDLAHDIFADGSGTRGFIASITTGVIQLTNPNDIVSFEVGMTLVSFSVAGTSATQSTGATLGYVIAVNRTLGTVTVEATPGGGAATPTNWSTTFPNLAQIGDTSFASGGLAAGAALKISGLAAWLPKTAPTTGDSFWNVDRSRDPTRLGGVRFDGSSETIEEALIDGASLVAREGGKPDYAIMPYSSFAALEKSLGAKVQYVDVKHDDAEVAFQGITINAPYGRIICLPDRSCPSQTAYLLSLKTWKLRSTGKMPHILTYGMEGLEALRVGNADAVEIRWGYYGNLVCNAPGWNCVVSLSQ